MNQEGRKRGQEAIQGRRGSESRKRRKERSGGCYTDRSRSKSRSRSGSSSLDDEVGHFPGARGDKLKNQYEIKELLGKGTFGKVYKCWDRFRDMNVAVKVVRRIERYVDSATIEGALLDDVNQEQRTRGANLCVTMFQRFHMDGYYCMVFEPLGLSIYDVIRQNDYKRLPLSMVQDVGRQLVEALAFLKSMKLIHTDLKLENILFVNPSMDNYQVWQDGREWTIQAPVQSRIKLIDFGGATYDDDPDKSRIISTRQYRSPEVTLELREKWSFPSDLWSAACIIAEMYTGDLLFNAHEELEHLALIEKIYGPFPPSILERSQLRGRYFDRDNRVKIQYLTEKSSDLILRAHSLSEMLSYDREEQDHYCGILEVMRGLLRIDPKDRMTAEEALRCYFFTHQPRSTHDRHGQEQGSRSASYNGRRSSYHEYRHRSRDQQHHWRRRDSRDRQQDHRNPRFSDERYYRDRPERREDYSDNGDRR